jgi:membrane protein YdbS with pleckstrin-like domain
VLASPNERICLEARRHGIVLVRPLLRSALLAALGLAGLTRGWPLSGLGAALAVAAALLALLAVWRWERTHVVVTTEKLFVVYGTIRRRAAAVHLTRVGAIELEQSLLGRLLGYGTLVAGELEITYVPEPKRVWRLVDRLAA